MPEARTLYPTANPTGTWQLNVPLALTSASPLARVKATAVTAYTAGDQAAPQVLDGEAEDYLVPSQAAAGDVALLMAMAVDETDGTVLPGGSAPTIKGTNEVQTLDSDHTGGTFTLTFGANTTGNLNAGSATASEVQTELEGLASIGVGNVQCTGGPIGSGGSTILIEFIGTLADADQALITVTDSGTGGTAVSTAEQTVGVPGTSFSGPTAVNVPRAGNDGESEIHIWDRTLTAADLNKPVSVTIADHGTLSSYLVIMIILSDVTTGTLIEASSTTLTGTDSGVTFTAVTVATAGALILTVEAHAPPGGGLLSGAASFPNQPSGMQPVAQLAGDTIAASVWKAGPAPSGDFLPDPVTWGPSSDFTAVTLALAPAAGLLAIANLWEAIDDESELEYIELTAANGALNELFEVDLSLLPAGSVITGVKAQFARMTSKATTVKVLPVAISGTGPATAIVPVRETSGGVSSEPLGLTQVHTTDEWTELADGTSWKDYTRLGFTVTKLGQPVGLATDRLYWVRLVVIYDEGGPTVSAVVAPAVAGDEVEWTYSNPTGQPQANYRVMLIAGAGQDPTLATVASDPASPSTGEIFHDSGKLSGDAARSYSLDDIPLIPGDFTVAVQTWALSSSGVEVESAWGTTNANLGAGPTPGAQSSDPTFDAVNGLVEVVIDAVPVGATRAWIWRSLDSGVNWELANPGDPFAVTAPGPTTYTDRGAPTRTTTLQYQVTFDTGSASPSSLVVTMPGGDVSTAATTWYFIDPNGIVPTFQPEVDGSQDYLQGQEIVSLTVEGPGRAVVLNSDPLPALLDFRVRIRDATQKAALEAFILGGFTFRVTDILGQSWLVRPTQGAIRSMQRWQEPGTTAQLADAHYVPVTLKEVTG